MPNAVFTLFVVISLISTVAINGQNPVNISSKPFDTIQVKVKNSEEVQSSGWNGEYKGSINAVPASMSITEAGNQLKGTIIAQGYQYDFEGTATATESTGTLNDAQTQAKMKYRAVLNENGLIFTLIAVDRVTGQDQFFDIYFQESELEIVKQPVDQGIPQNTDFERDQRLIGFWLYTQSNADPVAGFSAVVQFKLQISADGTFTYGDGSVAGGTAGVTGSSAGGDVDRGYWRTEGGAIYVSSDTKNWQPYAYYSVSDTGLLFTFADESKQLFKRS